MDPIALSRATELVVCRDGRRSYWRFRPAKFYGGIATCDCCGCNLRCVYCWSWEHVVKPEACGEFYTAEEAGERLISIARRHGFGKVRVSGGEPTICKDHLLELIDYVSRNSDLLFILETNGLLIGADENYAKELSQFPNLYVRVSLKGVDAKVFSKISTADERFFDLQIRALENLAKYDVDCRAALMLELAGGNSEELLKERLGRIKPELADVEYETLILYPRIVERLKRWDRQFVERILERRAQLNPF